MTFKLCYKLTLLLTLLFAIAAGSTKLEVGDEKGWALPSSEHAAANFYNLWASKNRFKVDDTVHFKYKKDSVLVVTEAEYEKCRSTQPLFFSNNGDTVFALDRAGPFYFISGISGHCERGQKMIIKVLEPIPAALPPSSSRDQTASSTDRVNAHLLFSIFSFILIVVISLFWG